MDLTFHAMHLPNFLRRLCVFSRKEWHKVPYDTINAIFECHKSSKGAPFMWYIFQLSFKVSVSFCRKSDTKMFMWMLWSGAMNGETCQLVIYELVEFEQKIDSDSRLQENDRSIQRILGHIPLRIFLNIGNIGGGGSIHLASFFCQVETKDFTTRNRIAKHSIHFGYPFIVI